MLRRNFLESATAATVVTALAAIESNTAHAANDKIAICMTGVRGRGGSVLSTFATLPQVEVRYVCDLDEQVLAARIAQVEQKTGKKPIGIKDYRTALEDKSLDALVLGTPDHWHALPTIHACQAGKDVYVEKPDGHNIIEGQVMVAAQRKYNRIVQLGTQARSGPHLLSCLEYLKTGAIGKVRFAKAWESAQQGSIGHPPDGQAPAGFDYDTWLGPAPLRAFNPRRSHGSWRWFFDYGTGDLGNDGVHRLDIARWALATAAAAQKETLPDVPRSVASLGGKYYFDDAQEWPDTLMVTYDFAPRLGAGPTSLPLRLGEAGSRPSLALGEGRGEGRIRREGGYLLTYEMRVWNAYPLHDEDEGAAVCGDNGSVIIGNTRWRAFDPKGKLIKEETAAYNDLGHAQNFLDSLRSRTPPSADLATIGHPSSLLCHLGNAAWRAGRILHFDPATYTFQGDPEANQFLTRKEYRKPWVLPGVGEV